MRPRKYKTEKQRKAAARAAWRRYRAKNVPKHNARVRKWYAANKALFRIWQRERLYPAPTRIEPKTCEICHKRSNRALCLDHDHETGKFRGWICHKCNLGLAYLGDNAQGIARALKYLKGEGLSV